LKVLEVVEVYKKLGKREIIKGISFSVEEGEIFGFLGPNGAGKTTTIRMLVGLIAPNKGTISIMGKDVIKYRAEALSQVGAVVENPELYSYLSGRENLMQIARIRKVPKAQVDDTIELVGLTSRIDDKVRKYSLGMKQRLGLAAALLSEPKLLILDEPTNGLDPSGILDFREIVKKASKERGMAVFVSSHILGEIQQLCDRVAYINGGVIQAIERLNENAEKLEHDIYTLKVRDSKKVEEVLGKLSFISEIKAEEEGYTLLSEVDTSPEIVQALVAEGIQVREIYKKYKGVEQRYIELVEGGIR